MKNGECGSCIFYHPCSDGHGIIDLSQGLCRFMPPQPLCYQTATGAPIVKWDYPNVARIAPNCAQWTERK